MNLEQLFPDGIQCPRDCSCHGPQVTPAQVLRRAARVLREEGWCKGALMDGAGRRCLLGAVDAAASRMPFYSHRAQAWAMVALSDYLGGYTFAAFNDAPGRTVDQVLVLLEAVADQEDARAGVAQQPERWATSPEVAGSTPASRSILDVDQLQSASGSEPGWEAYADLSPLEARYADGDR
jgi:hypothetical protein